MRVRRSSQYRGRSTTLGCFPRKATMGSLLATPPSDQRPRCLRVTGPFFAKVAQGLPRAPGPLTSMPGSTTVRRPSLFVPPLGRSRWPCLGLRWASMTDARPPASCRSDTVAHPPIPSGSFARMTDCYAQPAGDTVSGARPPLLALSRLDWGRRAQHLWAALLSSGGAAF